MDSIPCCARSCLYLLSTLPTAYSHGMAHRIDANVHVSLAPHCNQIECITLFWNVKYDLGVMIERVGDFIRNKLDIPDFICLY